MGVDKLHVVRPFARSSRNVDLDSFNYFLRKAGELASFKWPTGNRLASGKTICFIYILLYVIFLLVKFLLKTSVILLPLSTHHRTIYTSVPALLPKFDRLLLFFPAPFIHPASECAERPQGNTRTQTSAHCIASKSDLKPACAMGCSEMLPYIDLYSILPIFINLRPLESRFSRQDV